MTARLFVVFALLVAASTAFADAPIDHARTRFPLTGRHATVACESCHPASGGTRKWKGVPLDCHGCHGDRRNHKGALGPQCQLCHDVSGWKSIKHEASQHRFAITGKHDLQCANCHAAGAHLSPTVTCADCHKQTHGGTRSPCETCHVVSNWKSVFFKKHTFDPALLPGKHRTATCLGCHAAFQFKGVTTECESCHHTKPHEDLGGCKQCHSPLSWKDVKPDHRTGAALPTGDKPVVENKTPIEQQASTDTTGIFRVKSSFNHVTHERQVKARGLKPNCASCHVGTDFIKQRPTMQACEACHDGKTAFDARGTQCDRCHQAPPGTPMVALPPSPKLFQHGAHTNHKVKIEDCTSCHGVGVTWETVQSGRDQHKPCQVCHAAEFRTPGQMICLGCHVRNDPFRPNPLRPHTQAKSEFRSPDARDLPHAGHIAGGLACETCHAKPAGKPPREPTLGHQVCVKCHWEKRMVTAKGTPVTLKQCASCHVLSSIPRQTSGKRPWSTRDHFRHDKDHRLCVPCHLPDGAKDLTPPTMRYCATCHDGKKSFKTIDRNGCIRCHDQ